MATYVRKLMPIEATQWFKNGDHPDDYKEDHQGLENGELRAFTGAERKANAWEGGVVRYFRHPDIPGETICPGCKRIMHEHGFLDCGGEGQRVCPGDWVLTMRRGVYVAYPDNIFTNLYQVVTAA